MENEKIHQEEGVELNFKIHLEEISDYIDQTTPPAAASAVTVKLPDKPWVELFD